jgi:hypothetical protein
MEDGPSGSLKNLEDELSASSRVSFDSNRESPFEDYRRRFITSIDKRIRDVEDNIYGNQKLLRDYESKLLSESDPREQMKIKQNIFQVKEFLDSCRDEYIGLIKYIGYVETDLLSNVLQDQR